MESENLNYVGNPDTADIIIVCDVPSQATWDKGEVLPRNQLSVLSENAKKSGLEPSRFFLVTCAPPLPPEATTDGRINKFVDTYRDELFEVLGLVENPNLLLYTGKTAARVFEGSSQKITKVAGRFKDVDFWRTPVLPMLSPAMILRRPEQIELQRYP